MVVTHMIFLINFSLSFTASGVRLPDSGDLPYVVSKPVSSVHLEPGILVQKHRFGVQLFIG